MDPTIPAKAPKRFPLTLFFCVATIFIGYFIANTIRMSYLMRTNSISMPQEMAFFSQPANNFWIDSSVLLISSAALILGGWLASKRMQGRGWLDGAIIGAVWGFGVMIIVVLYYLNGINLAGDFAAPEFLKLNFTQEKLNAYLAGVPVDILKALILCTAGGVVLDIRRWIKESKEKKKEKEEFRPKSYDELFKNSF